MLRLDSSEMLPGSQKGEETAQILSTAIVVVTLATRGSLAMIAFTKGNETGRDATRRASLPCAPCENGETQQVTYSVLGCSFKYEGRRRIFRLGSFCLNSTK